MNQDNNINQYINTSIDTKVIPVQIKRCPDIDEHNHVFDELHEECGVFGMYDLMEEMSHPLSIMAFCASAQRTGKLWYCSE